MMATDVFIRLGTAFMLALAALPAMADAPAHPAWLGLADLRQPSASRVYPLDANPDPTPARLHYIPLAPPTTARIACCLRPGRAVAATEEEDALAPFELLADTEDRPLVRRTLARPPRSIGAPMIALAVAGPVPKVQAVSAHRLRLTWPGQARTWLLGHCASAEGLHVRLQPADGSTPPRAFYLPLGMDVEADCPDDMLTPPAVPAAPITR
jgi:hypothetical protein